MLVIGPLRCETRVCVAGRGIETWEMDLNRCRDSHETGRVSTCQLVPSQSAQLHTDVY